MDNQNFYSNISISEVEILRPLELKLLISIRATIACGRRFFAGNRHLAERFGAHYVTISKALSRLQSEGLIIITESKGRRIITLGGAVETPKDEDPPVDNPVDNSGCDRGDQGGGVSLHGLGGLAWEAKGGKPGRLTIQKTDLTNNKGTNRSIKGIAGASASASASFDAAQSPVDNQPKKQSKPNRFKYREFCESDFSIPASWTREAVDALARWVTYKARIGKSCLLESYQALVDSWSDAPGDFAAAVALSHQNGWSGIFRRQRAPGRKTREEADRDFFAEVEAHCRRMEALEKSGALAPAAPVVSTDEEGDEWA